MRSLNITFEIDGQRFEVSSSWLRDEAELERHEHSVRGDVLRLLEGQFADEWASMGRVDPDRADDVRQLEAFSRFIASIEAHGSLGGRELCQLGYRADERRVDARFRQITEEELERMERNAGDMNP